jgi:hypothetical protein
MDLSLFLTQWLHLPVLQLHDVPHEWPDPPPSLDVRAAGAETSFDTFLHPQSGHGEVSPRFATRSSYTFSHLLHSNL